MERQASMKFNKENISIAAIILFYTVGLVGFYVPAIEPAFLKIVPWFILLMIGLICVNHDTFDYKFAIFMAFIVLLGYGAEWKGINKHTLFGEYSYGETLGVKFDDVPLIIGFNWLLITYAVGVFMRYAIAGYASARIIAGAVLMVFLDMTIEPVATKFDYWHWRIGNSQLNAPISNYIDWFFVSLLMLTLFELFQFKKQNKVGVALLAAQFVFFVLLHWA
jgi:putative membrane protein